MKTLLLAFILLHSCFAFSQVKVYSGFIDKYPITLMWDIDSDEDNGFVRALYVYDNFDSPIEIVGDISKGNLQLHEHDSLDKITATFTFDQFDPKSKSLTGKWVQDSKKKPLTVTLTETTRFYDFDESAFENMEILTPFSTPQQYFKLLLSKKPDEEVKVSGVRVYEKKTDRLIQEIELSCEFNRYNSLTIGDFNFDGLTDFSVFEASYAGSNISHQYLLRQSNSEQYFISDFEGTSLEFDQENKLIYEHNQCCAGTSHIYRSYKVVDNKMILVDEKCYKYNEEAGELILTKCEEE